MIMAPEQIANQSIMPCPTRGGGGGGGRGQGLMSSVIGNNNSPPGKGNTTTQLAMLIPVAITINCIIATT
jgi:hypothetical protein